MCSLSYWISLVVVLCYVSVSGNDVAVKISEDTFQHIIEEIRNGSSLRFINGSDTHHHHNATQLRSSGFREMSNGKLIIQMLDPRAHKTEKLQENNDYDGFQVWRTMLHDRSDANFIQKMEKLGEISLWILISDKAEFLVKPSQKLAVARKLQTRKLNHTVMIIDVQKRIERLKPKQRLWTVTSMRIGHKLNWKDYYELAIIEDFYKYCSGNYASICKVDDVGKTAENRSIKMITISNGNPQNKGILLLAGMHAREWIAITSILYILNNVVSKFDDNPSYMRDVDWYFIPVLNPDGYEYTFTQDRLWRKNRNKRGNCIGVDINRNFDEDWEVHNITEHNPCQSSYSGPSPFSEAESQAIKNVVSLKKPSALIDLHSYGQQIVYPWGSKQMTADDSDKLNSTAQGMSSAIFNETQQRYSFGQMYHLIYPASGTLLDWAYKAGIKQAFAIELRDTGIHGFLAPPEMIEKTAEDTWTAVKHLASDLPKSSTRSRWF